ncbi:unnamed protein product [Orchesella dallaii]|uniref:Uncharacterized protein n=1 Tax=Orchesella dallaii TaxID=48710 RepID=A0ABP1R4C2_9HEXA
MPTMPTLSLVDDCIGIGIDFSVYLSVERAAAAGNVNTAKKQSLTKVANINEICSEENVEAVKNRKQKVCGDAVLPRINYNYSRIKRGIATSIGLEVEVRKSTDEYDRPIVFASSLQKRKERPDHIKKNKAQPLTFGKRKFQDYREGQIGTRKFPLAVQGNEDYKARAPSFKLIDEILGTRFQRPNTQSSKPIDSRVKGEKNEGRKDETKAIRQDDIE